MQARCPNCGYEAVTEKPIRFTGTFRYGGLRCPSEVLALKFEDIDWASGRFRVTSPKTKRYGKGSRVVPLFPELAIFLRDTMETAPVGKVYVIWKYRGENLRTEFDRIVERAGVDRWPRLFHNLRASRQTELENQFPTHVVCKWLGNTPGVASKHYLQTTEEHFKTAQSVDQSGADLAAGEPKTVQSGADLAAACQSTLELETKKASTIAEAFLKCAPVDSLMQILKAPPVGLEPTTNGLTVRCSTN